MLPSNVVEWMWFVFFTGGCLGGLHHIFHTIVDRRKARGDIELLVNGAPLKNAVVETSGAIIVTARLGGPSEISDAALDASLHAARMKLWPTLPTVPAVIPDKTDE
jgi:hypothetical protein